jgi:hypothetical protein
MVIYGFEASMKNRNLTLSLPYPLVRKAKELAVREDRSLNDYVREAIERRTPAPRAMGEGETSTGPP